MIDSRYSPPCPTGSVRTLLWSIYFGWGRGTGIYDPGVRSNLPLLGGPPSIGWISLYWEDLPLLGGPPSIGRLFSRTTLYREVSGVSSPWIPPLFGRGTPRDSLVKPGSKHSLGKHISRRQHYGVFHGPPSIGRFFSPIGRFLHFVPRYAFLPDSIRASHGPHGNGAVRE